MPGKIGRFRFRNTDQIGAAGAEDDEFLKTCFVDTGNLRILEDLDDHRQIVLGRTGSGKSALLLMLGADRQHQVIKISPEGLALRYVSNSTILNFFEDLGVNLDPFFKLLWRHVLAIEILRDYFSKYEKGNKTSPWESLRHMFTDNSRQHRKNREAISYLEKWGSKFWKETEDRVKEITQRVEKDLGAEVKTGLGISFLDLGGQATAHQTLTEEKKLELRSRGQEIISQAQVEGLQKILELLDSILDDRQKAYYVVIDALDENWVEERLRYKLIMALIFNSREFLNVKNAKLVIALRRDLIERVFKMTCDSGFQEEKYQSLCLQLNWDKEQILEVLDSRINQLVERSYTKGSVNRKDLFPQKYEGQDIDDFIFSIAPRPRDVIAFFNTFFTTATHSTKISKQDLKTAEGEYSQSRLRALRDEWRGDYPTLLEFAKILQGQSTSFKIETIKPTQVSDLCLQQVISENPGRRDILLNYAIQVVNCILDIPTFTILLMRSFYHVGLIGIKLQPHESVSYVDKYRVISNSEITLSTSVVIFPPYRRALGIVEKK